MFVRVNIRVYTDSTGAYTELPGLLTPAGVLMPLLRYCLSRRHDRSIAWMLKVIRSVRLFLEYMYANPSERDTHKLFLSFAHRLYSGTFDLDTGLDPSGLAWHARSTTDARDIITYLNFFFKWLSDERPEAAKINPEYAGNAFDQACDEAAYIRRRDAALLKHIWDKKSTPCSGRKTRARRVTQVRASTFAFPEEKFMELLIRGFKVGNKWDLRGILIVLLCHGAGFRVSEPFHLYIQDVFPDPFNPKSAIVRIHHPEIGAAPSDWRDLRGRNRHGNRTTYLAEQFGLLPRNSLLKSQHAGWKGGLHDGEYYKEAHWFEPELGEIFLTVWKKYLHQVAQVNRKHPFAFVNLKNMPLGSMYTIAQFRRAHAAACRRIGLKVAKELGTSTHGHRHAYGRKLQKGGVDPAFIQKFMHHASEESQKVYTSPTGAQTREALREAAEKLRRAYPSNHNQSIETPWSE